MASSSDPRRRDNSSESFEDNLANNLQLLSFLEAIADDETSSAAPQPAGGHLGPADGELKRMLSLHSVICTASSDAKHYTAAQQRDSESFKKIGAGACGIIFCQEGKSLVVKFAKAGYQPDLFNDFKSHSTIQAGFEAYGTGDVKIPACLSFVPSDDPIFFDCRPTLLEAAQSQCDLPTCAVVTERIWPLPEATRTLLIERYCANRNKENALADQANKDCLVRPYLGSSRGRSSAMFFSLRNFKMHLNQMMEIQLDVVEMARRMAVAMAIMHWAAKTDARDVEFVLGSSTLKKPSGAENRDLANQNGPHRYIGPPSRLDEDFYHRTTELWILDFNQVRPITMDAAGVAQAVQAATINDPYLPKPLQSSAAEIKVWNAFVKSYLTTSRRILEDHGEGGMALPGMFLQGLIDVQREKQA
ncbi:zinc finger protein [Hirsutella rhossiliensis]|uniref:Zinc finger protein n=1 Tax=Hirsutella rhossiliensis TaxID=111463 RepID=A0A9P8NAP9_9HYPO|nr:zinc finger protein [Hirsutella rhossiliensis]KAH0967692.1 zinc finger protein [Hirsutella rhossiliensis]